MLFKIKTFLYDALKHIVEENGTIQYRRLHYADLVLYLYWLIRALFISLIYIDPERFPLYRYDYASLYFWDHRRILNKFFVIIIFLLIMIGLLCIKTFYFPKQHDDDELRFQVLYDCIVHNTDQYYKSRDTDENIAMKLSQRYENYHQQFVRNHRLLSQITPIAKRVVSFKVWRDSWLEMDRVDKILFEKINKMKLFPYATFKGRSYIVLFILFADRVNYIGHLLYILYQLFSYELVKNSLWMKITLMIETTIFIYNAFLLIQSAMLLACTIMSTYQAFHSGLSYLNQMFVSILDKSRHHNGKQITRKDVLNLGLIYRQHNKLSYYVLHDDKNTWSQSLYYYALISIPINITLLCELIVEDIPAQTEFVFIVIAVVHAITGVIPFMALAHVSSAFHKIRDHILPMQLKLKRNYLRTKLKYDDLYERLMHGKKIAFTFGYLGNLTFRGLFEAFLSYIAAFFLIMGFYMKEHST
ncbi:hypothetical protein HUG17_0852 [Dermatophagoides farinae]|uniref:Uncharacterized protein n=1 Tax=Dermatophagoides farinae TaxID=6954 RepID=A0A9D4P6Q7_DERFA|nr:hypothetical protein HUG17_0852 [Dermatophagoides farinae]